MRVVVWTDDLSLYARLAPALWAAGVAVSWREGEGLPLADLAHLERGEVFFWPTPWGLRVYDPRRRAFLTRKDDPKTLAEGLRGRLGLRLTGREAGVLEALGRGVEPRPSALGRALGLAPWQARFALQGLGRKFGLSLEALLRLARHQVQVAGLQDHLDPPPGREVEPGLHVPGVEVGEGVGALEAPPVGQALGVEAFQ